MTTHSRNQSEIKQSLPPDLELLTPKEAARFLKMSESFLAKARMRGDGPRYRKLSRSVRYSKPDLVLWLKACAKTSTAEGSGSEQVASIQGNAQNGHPGYAWHDSRQQLKNLAMAVSLRPARCR